MTIEVGQVQLALYTTYYTHLPTQPHISKQGKNGFPSLSSWAKLTTPTFRNAVSILLSFAKVQYTQKFSEKFNR